jgi:hypothetical protein
MGRGKGSPVSVPSTMAMSRPSSFSSSTMPKAAWQSEHGTTVYKAGGRRATGENGARSQCNSKERGTLTDAKRRRATRRNVLIYRPTRALLVCYIREKGEGWVGVWVGVGGGGRRPGM